MVEPQRPTTSSEAMAYSLIMVIIALIFLVVRVSYMAYKYRYLANYRRGMVREVRSILKAEGERRNRLRVRREAREAQIARLGIELCKGGGSEGSDFSEDKEIHIRSVKLERTENNMEEEQQESEAEMAEDDVVDDDAAEREAV